jgi:hypothetical protein
VKAALGVWVLTLAAGWPPEDAIRADVGRWPPPALIQGRLDFVKARLAHVRERQRWDVLNREALEEEERELARALSAWEKAGKATDEMGWGYPRLSALYLGELRERLGEKDYRAGRLPPIPDMVRFAWAD